MKYIIFFKLITFSFFSYSEFIMLTRTNGESLFVNMDKVYYIEKQHYKGGSIVVDTFNRTRVNESIEEIEEKLNKKYEQRMKCSSS